MCYINNLMLNIDDVILHYMKKTTITIFLLSIIFIFSCSPQQQQENKNDSTNTTKLTAAGKPICPKGNTDSIIPIIYGLPTSETGQKAERGEIWLGGCDEDSLSPHWYCKIHKIEF
jgi:hypothetical protein